MSTPIESRLAVPINEKDHIRGPVDARMTLVEYGDYECPHCGLAYPVVEAIRDELGDQLRFVYRHFALTQIHPHAQSAAEAAEEAGAQGHFWEMHDSLFANQDALDEAHLILYAAAIDLDVGKFRRALATHAHAPKVREDFLGGVRSGVNGTPTFFINDVRYSGPYDFDSLFAAILDAYGLEAA